MKPPDQSIRRNFCWREHKATHLALRISYGLGALGPGYIDANNINAALKCFPNKRAVAVGLIDGLLLNRSLIHRSVNSWARLGTGDFGAVLFVHCSRRTASRFWADLERMLDC